MGRKIKFLSILLILGALLLTSTGCNSSSDTSSGGSGNLTFAIWDTFQRDGMQEIVDLYHESHPDVNIEVQVTNWNEYWTKLEAGITSHTAPDIFWMHTTYILEYADAGILANVGDLFNPDDFSETALACAKGTNGEYYGVPKDKDTIGLIYNKELFDEAGVPYPDANWTWTELSNYSEQIYQKTGKYGFLAYNDAQIGYYPFVYQAGGYIINEEGGGFTDPATEKAIKYYVGLQDNDWCPDQNYFAQNSPGSTFFSGEGAMFLDGSWNLKNDLTDNEPMIGKWDVSVLPKCPDPPKGDGRATVSNSLTYATTADNPNLDQVKDFLEFLGTEEAQRIQGTTGTAIPAYKGLENTWVDWFKQKGYNVNADAFVQMFDYAQAMPNDQSKPSWQTSVTATLSQIYNKDLTYEEGLETMQGLVDDAMVGNS